MFAIKNGIKELHCKESLSGKSKNQNKRKKGKKKKVLHITTRS